jgi:hypothetical protein
MCAVRRRRSRDERWPLPLAADSVDKLTVYQDVNRGVSSMSGGDAGEDPEVAAMSTLLAVLGPLDAAAQARVLGWIAGRLDVKMSHAARPHAGKPPPPDGSTPDTGDAEGDTGAGKTKAFGSLADLYDAAGPKTDSEKALVGAYWEQVCGGKDHFEGGPVNSGLKHLGHGLKNVTQALNGLKNQKPALVMQTLKAGKAKQARKKYKLTDAGIKAAEAMIGG